MKVNPLSFAQRLIVTFVLGIIMTGCAHSDPRDSMKALPTPAPTVVIVHGYAAGPNDHWFRWLADELAAYGATAKIVELPNSSDPDPMEWETSLQRQVGKISEETYIVAHSLGCVSVLGLLSNTEEESFQSTHLGGLVLVSGFTESLSLLPELDTFTSRPLNLDAVRDIDAPIAVLLSTDDPIVPPDDTRNLAIALGAELTEIPLSGHFLGRDGYTTFPQVRDIVLRMINSEQASQQH